MRFQPPQPVIIQAMKASDLPRPTISVRSAVVARVSWAHEVVGSIPTAQTNHH